MDRLLDNQASIANTALLATLAAMLLLEMCIPRREPSVPRAPRWRLNFLLLGVNTLVLYATVPATTVALAVMVKSAGWGMLQKVALPASAALVVSVLAMDLARYAQHFLMHRVPQLWRVHRVHHSDADLDVTTSLRFHPLETLAGLLTDSIVIIVLGPPAVAVVVHQLIRVAVSSFDHSNIRIPHAMESVLRLLLVTPDMHRIHHSVVEREQRGNLSGGLSCWDHLFRTFIGNPVEDHRTMALGLAGYPEARGNSLRSALVEPFAR